MSLKVTLVQGGGMGLDQVPAVRRVLAAAGVAIDWDEYTAGWASLEKGGAALPEDLLQSVRANGLALKTKLLPPPGEEPGPGHKETGNFNVQFRRELGLFASVRPLKNLPGLSARFTGVDMLVVRELTEDLYAAIEHEIVPGVVQSIKVVTEAASRRFFRFAFGWARGRPQVGGLRPQGQHPQIVRRPVPGGVPHHRQGVSRAANARNHRGQLLYANGVAAAAVRRDGDGQPVRRSGERPRRRRGGRRQRHARHQRRRRRARLRVVPRRPTGDGRRRPRQPAAAAAAGHRPARRRRRKGGGPARGNGRRPRADGTPRPDARPGRHSHDGGNGRSRRRRR